MLETACYWTDLLRLGEPASEWVRNDDSPIVGTSPQVGGALRGKGVAPNSLTGEGYSNNAADELRGKSTLRCAGRQDNPRGGPQRQ